MSKTESNYPNAILVSRLSIERCRAHLAHLHALMHLSRLGEEGWDSLVTESFLRIMETIEGELTCSASALSKFD